MSESLVPGPVKHFGSVRKAREALKEQALEILADYQRLIAMAAAAGQYEAALKAQQWLVEHIPAEEGQRIFDISVDKVKESEAPRGPMIQLGFQLGGMVAKPKELPEVISIESIEP